jgi:hypothetical protein
MNFLDFIDEQCLLGFTGKINILSAESAQFHGAIYLLSGIMVNAYFEGGKGTRALTNMVVSIQENEEKYKFISEPEIIEKSEVSFHVIFQDFKDNIFQKASQIQASQKHRPPENLKILLKEEFLVTGDEITRQEFTVMNTVSDFSKISDIYKNSTLSDSETTDALVLLRKKGAFTVQS